MTESAVPLGQVWSITEAAHLCGVHRNTVRRYLDAEDLPNAYKNAGGAWRIPQADLVAAGLYRTVIVEPTEALAAPAIDAAEVERLRAALELEKMRREAAEANLKDLRQALDQMGQAVHALTAGKEGRGRP